METRQLLRKKHGIPVTPARPKAALSAIVAEMWAPTGKLDHHGTQTAPIAIAGVVDEFPPDAVNVEVVDH
jgi:hypothetical protein